MMAALHADTAGIDIGAEEIVVAVPAERTPEPVRSFVSFTRDLHELADWLQECRVRTVAMESPGVYWIPLYQIFETRGFLGQIGHVSGIISSSPSFVAAHASLHRFSDNSTKAAARF